jgi:chromosome segregation ATPase
MESSKTYMHPSLVLVNDEILSTQVRLMELYVKQAEAMAATEAARTQEHFQAELTALQEELKQKEIALETQQALFHQADQDLRAEVQELRARLLATQCSLQVRQTELDFARSDAQVLQQRLAQSESTIQKAYASIEIEVARARATWQDELSALEGQLERKESAHQLLQTSVKEIEVKLRAETQDLRSQLSEKAKLLKDRTEELQNAQRETALLRRHMQQFALTGAQTEAAASEAIKTRDHLQAELVSVRTALEQKDLALKQTHAATTELEQRLNVQLRDLQTEVAENQGSLKTRDVKIGELSARIHDLQEQIVGLELAKKQTLEEAQSAARTMQDGLRARIQELEATVSEKARLLQDRSLEFESAQAETALLRERVQKLELSVHQTEAAQNEAERTREALQNQLANVQRALEHKEASLAQREAEFTESSERLDTHLHDLKNQLAEKQQWLEVKDGELGRAAGEIAGLEKRIAQLESLHAEAQAAAATEVDRLRQESQSERAALQTSLREKELALQERQAAIAELEAKLNGQIQGLKNDLIEKQYRLERRDQEFQNASSEAAALRERITQLESAAYQAEQSAAAEASRIRAELQTTLATLEAQLEEKEHQLAQSQAGARESEGQLQIQLHDLETQIAEKQLLLETRNFEMSGLQDQLTTASERIIQLESASQQAIAAAALDAEIAQQRFDAELAARQEELKNLKGLLAERETQSDDLGRTFNAQLENLQRELVEKQGLLDARSREIGELTAKTSDLQEQIICLELANKQTVKEANAAARALEDSLRARVQELEAAVSEKAQGLENGRQELEGAQSEIAVLRQRIEQLELARTQTEEAKNEADRMREGLQNELNNVQRALEQKDAWLAQREAEFKESSDRLQAQLSDLQSQLGDERAALESQTRELRSTQSEITVLRGKIEELESAKLTADTNASTGINRLREQYQLELASLRAELEQKQVALEARQRSLRVLEEKLSSEIHRLETQLAEKQSLLDRGQHQLQEKGSEISALQQEIARTEFARRQTEMLAATQAEQIRERVKAEVRAMDDQLREKDNALKNLTDRGSELELRIDNLQQHLTQKESLIESRDVEVNTLRGQANDLMSRISHLERVHGAALEQQRVVADQSEQSFRVQVNKLEAQLAEKLRLLETRNKEVHDLESKLKELVERLDQSAVALEQAREISAIEIEQMRQQSQAELAARQLEHDQKAEALQQRETALQSEEQKLQLEINRLRAEVAEKRSLLEDRNDELLRVRAEMDAFRERVADLESAVKQAESQSLNGPDRTDEYAKTALDRLWEELNQKERILEERQAAVNDLEQDFQAEIHELRSELAEKQALLENPSRDFLIGDPTISEAQKEKLSRLEKLVETIKADNEQTLMSPQNRKWRFSLGRKRRWKF